MREMWPQGEAVSEAFAEADELAGEAWVRGLAAGDRFTEEEGARQLRLAIAEVRDAALGEGLMRLLRDKRMDLVIEGEEVKWKAGK